jgi:hypothetical protein
MTRSLREIEGAFVEHAGLPHPDWERVWEAVSTDLAIEWVEALRERLGGAYGLLRSPDFLLVSALDERTAKLLLASAGRISSRIDRLLGPLLEQLYGPGVVLVFETREAYYDYLVPFHAEGVHAQSGGVFLSGGYNHVAFPPQTLEQLEHGLSHELTHLSTKWLYLPTWVNEGLALVVERDVSGLGRPMLTRERVEQHRVFWRACGLADFWSGDSYHTPGDSQLLSYELGEILLRLLMEGHPKKFLDVLRFAGKDGTGAEAVQTASGLTLGELAACFLGPGDWEPKAAASGSEEEPV